MEDLESFIRDIALKKDGNDQISIEFFKIISKSFWRITSNSVLQSRLVEEAIVYSIGIVMDLIDPNLKFKKALDLGLNNYIEKEPLIRTLEKSTTDLVRLTVVRVAYYIVFLKIAFDEELVSQERTRNIYEHFECIFKKYIPQEKVALDTKLSTEDFLQKIKFVYKQAYRSLPGVYIPANLFLSVSLIKLNDFENKEWRYYVNFDNLDKCLNILSSSRLDIERKRLYEYINKCFPEMQENFSISQMDRFISLHQAHKALNNQYIQLKQKVECHALMKSYTSSDELLSTILDLQHKLNEMTMNKVALESINISQQKEIASLQQTINELLLTNYNLKQINVEQEKELERTSSKNDMGFEKPDPLSFYIKDPHALKKIVEYAESESCTKKIHFYKYIYRELLDSVGMPVDILRSTEFLRALIPHLKHVKGINSQEMKRQDILNLQQTIRINDAKHR